MSDKSRNQRRRSFKFLRYCKYQSLTYHEYLIYCKYKPPPTCDTPSFFNFTSTDLSTHKSTFDLGIKHIPYPNPLAEPEVSEAWTNFENRTLWRFHHLGNEDIYEPSLHTKERVTPFPAPWKLLLPTRLLEGLSTIKQHIERVKKKEKMSHQPDKSFKRLHNFILNNPNIILKMTDKNLGLCVLTLKQYNAMVLTHLLSDRYEFIANSPNLVDQLTIFANTRIEYINAKNIIYQLFEDHPLQRQVVKFMSFFKLNDFEIPNFHVLPKLHKKKTVIPTRPIVSAIKWFTTPVSKILNMILQNHLNNLPISSILKNTNQFVRDIRQVEMPAFDPVILVTMDVRSLYTEIITTKLNQLIFDLDPRYSQLSAFITQNNYFSYDNRIFRQKDGIAMGTNAAPTMANLYLAILLDPYVREHPEVLFYRRFLDDLFIVWTGTESLLLEFFDTLQNLIPGILFDPVYSHSSIDFLDLTILYNSNRYSIEFKTHQKTLNRYSYITMKSFHPLHMFKSFINGELTRYRRNSSCYFYYNETKKLFYSRLRARGYLRYFLDPIFRKHTYIGPIREINSVPPTILPLILPYTMHTELPSVIQDIRKCQSLFRGIFPNPNIILAFRKRPNLANRLLRSKLNDKQNQLLLSYNNNLFPDPAPNPNHGSSSRPSPTPPKPTQGPKPPKKKRKRRSLSQELKARKARTG